MWPPSFTPFKHRSPSQKSAKGAAEFLRSHDRLAALLPSVTRMAALQKDCAAALPAMFAQCAILQFEAGQLVLGVPNTALAARLKQQLPKLQGQLLHRGWQVNAIRLKVQVAQPLDKSRVSVKKPLSEKALSAFDSLHHGLEDTPRNQTLKDALERLLRHQRNVKEG